MQHQLPKERVLGVDLSVGSFTDHVASIMELGYSRTSAYVCCVNVHMCVEAHKDEAFAEVVNGADLATVDGMPIRKGLNLFHHLHQERVAGNDLMPAVMAEAERRRLSIFLYGGQQKVLDAIVAKAAKEFPLLSIAGACSPPFRLLSQEEMTGMAEMVSASGAHIVLVSLGCPKQERWMAAMKGRIPAVMLGLGGAFLLYADIDRRAPNWMRDRSLEWLYRFALEPGRLWKRYLVTNAHFMWLFAKGYVKRTFAK